MTREEKEINDKIELNKRIALFNGDIESMDARVSMVRNCSVKNLKFTESWDWLMPVYKKLKLLVEDLGPTSYIFMDSVIYKYLDFLSTPQIFAQQLDKLIDFYTTEIEENQD
jgi:hypothetical protein